MFKVITHTQRTSIKMLRSQASRHRRLSCTYAGAAETKVWSSTCSSWFKNGRDGPVTAIWPGSRLHYFESLEEPRNEDLISDTLETGSRTWAMDTRMRSWKRREIWSGILTFCERNLRRGKIEEKGIKRVVIG
jgi:hypothetical protein